MRDVAARSRLGLERNAIWSATTDPHVWADMAYLRRQFFTKRIAQIRRLLGHP